MHDGSGGARLQREGARHGFVEALAQRGVGVDAAERVGGRRPVVVEAARPHVPDGCERRALRGRVLERCDAHVACVEERGCVQWRAEGWEGVRAEPRLCVGVDGCAGHFFG